MTLIELQKVLGERVRIASDDTIPAEKRKEENETSKTIASLAKQMINNADIVLRADKLIAEGKVTGSNIKTMIEGNKVI